MPRRYFLLFTALLLSGSLTLIAQSKVKVACVGNSITYGSGIKDRDSLSYPAQLQRMLGDQYEVHNYGVSGRTLLKKGDHPYWQEKAFQEVQDWQPNIIVIMLGTNDTKAWNWKYADDFTPDYAALLHVFKQLPSHPEIWAALPVPVFKTNYGIRDSILKMEMPLIRKLATAEDVHVLNLYKALQPYKAYFPDGVHPDKTGAHYLAEAVYQKIKP